MIKLPEITLNPAIDVSKCAAELQKNGRVQIHNFFAKDTAETLHQMVADHKPWYLAYNNGDSYYESDLAEFDALTPEQKTGFMNEIYAKACTQFQYVFCQYYITQAIDKGEDKGNPIHVMHDFVNGDIFTPFLKNLTGEENISFVEAFISKYRPGDFLTRHDDTHNKNDRVIAYTIGMTKNWDMNWGGHLAFYDNNGNIKHGLIPDFNTFNAFLIPQEHAVQMVNPSAGSARTSFLGWANR